MQVCILLRFAVVARDVAKSGPWRLIACDSERSGVPVPRLRVRSRRNERFDAIATMAQLQTSRAIVVESRSGHPSMYSNVEHLKNTR